MATGTDQGMHAERRETGPFFPFPAPGLSGVTSELTDFPPPHIIHDLKTWFVPFFPSVSDLALPVTFKGCQPAASALSLPVGAVNPPDQSETGVTASGPSFPGCDAAESPVLSACAKVRGRAIDKYSRRYVISSAGNSRPQTKKYGRSVTSFRL